MRQARRSHAANVLRYNIIEQLNLGEFQLSQSYLFFYDKLEKANYYLEYVVWRDLVASLRSRVETCSSS